jgi:hypothetical protein
MTPQKKEQLFTIAHRWNALVNTTLLGIITYFLIDLHKDFKEVKGQVQQQGTVLQVQQSVLISQGIDIEHLKDRVFYLTPKVN